MVFLEALFQDSVFQSGEYQPLESMEQVPVLMKYLWSGDSKIVFWVLQQRRKVEIYRQKHSSEEAIMLTFKLMKLKNETDKNALIIIWWSRRSYNSLVLEYQMKDNKVFLY